MTDSDKPEPEQSQEYQRFHNLASKLFKVPIKEVRELEAKQKQARAKRKKPASES